MAKRQRAEGTEHSERPEPQIDRIEPLLGPPTDEDNQRIVQQVFDALPGVGGSFVRSWADGKFALNIYWRTNKVGVKIRIKGNKFCEVQQFAVPTSMIAANIKLADLWVPGLHVGFFIQTHVAQFGFGECPQVQMFLETFKVDPSLFTPADCKCEAMNQYASQLKACCQVALSRWDQRALPATPSE